VLYFQLPLIKPYVRFSRIRLSNHLLPEAFADCSCLAFWYSLFRSSRNTLEFIALTAISFLHLFRNSMKVLPLPSPKVMLSLRSKRYYEQIRLPCRPGKISFPYIYRLPPNEHQQGSPVFIVAWLPLRVTPVTPEAHLSVLAVFVRIDAPVFPFVGEGRQLHCAFRGYIRVRSRCDPQVCSAPLRSLCQET